MKSKWKSLSLFASGCFLLVVGALVISYINPAYSLSDGAFLRSLIIMSCLCIIIGTVLLALSLLRMIKRTDAENPTQQLGFLLLFVLGTSMIIGILVGLLAMIIHPTTSIVARRIIDGAGLITSVLVASYFVGITSFLVAHGRFNARIQWHQYAFILCLFSSATFIVALLGLLPLNMLTLVFRALVTAVLMTIVFIIAINKSQDCTTLASKE